MFFDKNFEIHKKIYSFSFYLHFNKCLWIKDGPINPYIVNCQKGFDNFIFYFKNWKLIFGINFSTFLTKKGTDNRNSIDSIDGDSLSNYENYKVSNTNPRDVFSNDDKNYEPNFDFVNSTYDFNPYKEVQQTDAEFNPFEDVPNEIFKPFNYAAIIPPPDNFKESHSPNVFAPKKMQRVVNQAQLNSSSNESDDSDNYENLVNQSSKSIVQNFFNDFKNDQDDFENFSPTNNNKNLKNSANNDILGSNAISKKQMEKFKIENMSNSEYSGSPEDFNDYFK